MNKDRISELRINPHERTRPAHLVWPIYALVLLALAATLVLAWPRPEDSVRVLQDKESRDLEPGKAATPHLSTPAPVDSSLKDSTPGSGPASSNIVLTVSGYIINRERIELSPRFPGTVKSVHVKKGDRVAQGQILVLLDDTDQRALLLEAQGRLARAQADLERAEIRFQRTGQLAQQRVESVDARDDARLGLAAARGELMAAQGALAYAQAQLNWTLIRSPMNGVILEKLADPNELVTPQSFGGPRGPSTALLAMADPADLQVEIDLNESDLARVTLNQPCRVIPEAYPNRLYHGTVVEIAPEASRDKGTLEVKVQIHRPDAFLIPELTAKIEFLETPESMSSL